MVVLADASGRPVGTADKLSAHRMPGALHVAFSVFLFDPAGRTLLQRRAASKYHFPGIWANACCSHPEPGEEIVASARRRLREELGIDFTGELAEVGAFVYRAEDAASGLVEHEYDHVLVGTLPAGASVTPDPEEVDEWRWVGVADVASAGPDDGFAPWFAEALAIAVSGGGAPRTG